MPPSADGTPPRPDAADAEVGNDEVDDSADRVLERQRSARRLAEQTWPEFFLSLAVRTVVIIAVVLAVFFVLKLILG
jgi:hypothetical protein